MINNNTLFKRWGFTLIFLFSFLTLSAQQSNIDRPTKGKFYEIYTQPKSLTKGNEVYTAPASKLFADWKGSGFSLVYDAQGKQIFATGKYKSNERINIYSPEIVLPQVIENTKLYLQIEEKFATESSYDIMQVNISTDGGKSWSPLSINSGRTDWRTDYLNLTSYVGKTIKLSLSFSSDENMEEEGWSISSISIFTTGKDKKKMMTKGTAEAAQISSLEILNVYTEDYPEAVFVDFIAKDASGNFIDNLEFDDLIAWDNHVETSRCRDLFKSSTQGTNRPLDILFLMDNSGSMYTVQKNVENNVLRMVDKLSTSGQEVRMGLLRFGQGTNGGRPMVVPNPDNPTTAFFTDPVKFKTFWQTTNKIDGAYEPGYWAMVEGANNPLVSFRDYAQKIFVIITDESIIGHTQAGSNESAYSMQNAIDALNAKGISLYAITGNQYPFVTEYKPVVDATSNGKFYPVISQPDFTDLFDDIISSAQDIYTYRYCPDATLDIIDGSVCIPLQLAVKQNQSIKDNNCYYPKAKRRIIRTRSTQALDGISQNEGTNVTVGAEVLNGDDVTHVTLYYRRIDGTVPRTSVPFISATTTRVGGSTTFNATIPGTVVQRYSVDYYFVAHFPDGTTIMSPTEQKDYFAWTIPVKPNDAPVISNVNAPTQSYPCKDILIKANIYDITDILTKTVLYYKTNLVPGMYTAIPMTKTGSGYQYQATIPNNAMSSNGLTYYIFAEDNYGTQGWHGTPEKPIEIASIKGSLSSSGPMQIGIYKTDEVTVGCSPMSGNDIIKAYFMNDCKELQEAGSVTFDPNFGFVMFYIYGRSGVAYKDGFDMGEKIHFRLIRGNKEYDLNILTNTGETEVKYNAAFHLFNALTGVGRSGINVKGNNLTIVPDDITPDVNDGTDFETQTNQTTHSFTIQNTGCTELRITGITVSDNTNFEVSSSVSTIAAGATGTFSITYKPINEGTTNSSVYILNNSDINPYIFSVKGTKDEPNNNPCGASMYPNPTTSSDGAYLSFNVTGIYYTTIMIYDAWGAPIKLALTPSVFVPGRATVFIKTSGLAPGIYVANIKNGDTYCNATFIVQ